MTHTPARLLHRRLEQILAVSDCLRQLAADEENGAATPQSLERMSSLNGAIQALLEQADDQAQELGMLIWQTRQPHLVAAPKAD
jgi:hypothetical protein